MMERRAVRQRYLPVLISGMETIDAVMAKRSFAMSILAMAVGAALYRQLLPLVPAVPYVFALMTLSVAMGCSWCQFGTVAKRPLPLAAALLGLHCVGPLVGKLLGSIIFGSTSLLTFGFVLGMAVPTGTTSVMWAGLARANLPLSISLVALDSLLSPLVVPLTLKVFAGELVRFDTWGLLGSLCFTIVIPTIIGVSLNDFSSGRVPERLKWITGPFVKLGLCFVIAVNIAGSWLQIVEIKDRMAPLLGGLLALAVFGYSQGFALSRLLREDMSTTKSLTFSVGMRNISAGIVIAMTYFPLDAAVPVVAATLFQQPLATLVYRYFEHREKPQPVRSELSV